MELGDEDENLEALGVVDVDLLLARLAFLLNFGRFRDFDSLSSDFSCHRIDWFIA